MSGGAQRALLIFSLAERFLREVETSGVKLLDRLSRNIVLHIDLAIFDLAHIEVDDCLVILRPDIFRALRMFDRFLDFHSFEGPDEVGCVLLRLPAAFLDGLLNKEEAFPVRPVVAAGEHAVAARFAAVDRINFHDLAHLLIEICVLVLEHTRVVLEQVNALRCATNVFRADCFVRAKHRVAVHMLVEAERFALCVIRHRLRAEEDRIELLGVGRHLREIGQEIFSVERDCDRVVHILAEFFQHCHVILVIRPDPAKIGEEESPILAKIAIGPLAARCRL